ncbi:Holliday junction branch migration protein RuvA [Thermovibrio sp.]
MVEFITGEVVEKGEGFVVVRAGNFGFKVLVPDAEGIEGKVKLYTYLTIPQEGTPSLYGFKTKEERELFKTLTKVPKVGSKLALSILGSFEYRELLKVIKEGNYKELTKVPGLGEKLSKRVVLELQGKLKEDGVPRELEEALKRLGYKREEIKEALKGINLSGLKLEEALKLALKRLSGSKF